jgi:hypothetical protein
MGHYYSELSDYQQAQVGGKIVSTVDDTWQPIETAPKDGTEILIYDTQAKEIWKVFWGWSNNKDFTTQEYYRTWELSHPRSKQTEEYWGTPTHWMPLPNNPTDTL